MSKAIEEMNWWKNFYNNNKENFTNIREKDWFNRSKNLPGLKDEIGVGLDYGCGLLSMLEFSGLKFDAIDPLIDGYREILALPDNYQKDTNKKYDWILCCNVLDHTDKPEELIADIKNKLKPGGRLYLEINFDDSLGNCHYEIYNKEKVDSLIDLEMIFETTERIEQDKQTAYYAKYKS